MPLPTDKKALALSHDLLEAFDKVNSGEHSGYRPAHAKGIMLTGIFHPSREMPHSPVRPTHKGSPR